FLDGCCGAGVLFAGCAEDRHLDGVLDERFAIAVGAAREEHERLHFRMTTRGLNRLVYATTAADNSHHGFVHGFLGREEFERCIDITGHLVAPRSEVRILRVLASAEAAKI